VSYLSRNQKTILKEKLLFLQDMSSVVCREIFSEEMNTAWQLETSLLRLFHKVMLVKLQGENGLQIPRG
jgi:hypothetical protein